MVSVGPNGAENEEKRLAMFGGTASRFSGPIRGGTSGAGFTFSSWGKSLRTTPFSS